MLEKKLVEFAHSFRHDPLAFVLFSWEGVHPYDWQEEVLLDIGNQLKAGLITTQEAIQIAVASGHGIGKSCLVAWIILWGICTQSDTKGVVTANTENQLKTKTVAEVAKWHGKWRYKHWFTMTATALISTSDGHDKTWRIDFIAWSERNTEAFAGLHNAGKRVLIIFDEASAIPDTIWEVSEGALTDEDTEIVWLAFGNPTRNIGRFRECFNKFRHRWKIRQIDSRTVPGTNKTKIKEWADDYGEDSDFFRVRVRGQFPNSSFNAILGPEDIDAAMKRTVPFGSQNHAAVILGVDVARQGDDSSCIARRNGLVAHQLRMLRIPDTQLVAGQVAQEMDTHKPDGVFIDETGGYGAGVIDGLRVLNRDCVGVMFNGKALDPRYFNKRAEMYFELAKWVKSGGCLPDDPELKHELEATEYSFQGDKFRLASKDEIKEAIGRSPDKADALALTFAYPVIKQGVRSLGGRGDNYAPSPFGEKGIW